MADPKPFASLTSGLLARKGGAKPAMRRQGMMGFGTGSTGHSPQDDLGWNDMGDAPVQPEYANPAAGLTPMQPMPAETPVAVLPVTALPVAETASTAAPATAVPTVLEQQNSLAEAFATVSTEKAPPIATAKARKSKAAFTLRLDPERHLRLRLACAVDNRSAQQIVTEALDAFLNSQPEIEALADRVPRTGTGK